MSRHERGSKRGTVPTGPGLAARFLAFAALQDHSIKELPTDRIWPIVTRYRHGSGHLRMSFFRGVSSDGARLII
jgi:hypothetical protein